MSEQKQKSYLKEVVFLFEGESRGSGGGVQKHVESRVGLLKVNPSFNSTHPDSSDAMKAVQSPART